jgi:UDP-glucuronate decarboxylase
MLRMMNDTPDDFTGPVNIGNVHEFSIEQLAKEVIELTNSKSNIVYSDLPLDDPRVRQPDASLASRMLGGWEAKIHLRDGLKKTIEYFDKVLANGSF